MSERKWKTVGSLDPDTHPFTSSLLFAGCPWVAVGLPMLLLPSCHMKAAGMCWGPAVPHLRLGDLILRAQQVKGPPSLTLPECTGLRWSSWALLVKNSLTWKGRAVRAVVQDDFCAATCHSFKLILCLVIKCKLLKDRGYKAAVLACSSASRTADGWLTGLLFW